MNKQMNDETEKRKPTISISEVARLREDHSNAEVAKLLGVSRGTIQNIVNKYNLPRKKPGAQIKYID